MHEVLVHCDFLFNHFWEQDNTFHCALYYVQLSCDKWCTSYVSYDDMYIINTI